MYFNNRFRFFLIASLFVLASVPSVKSLYGRWTEHAIDLPKTESTSPLLVFPKSADEIPAGRGSGPHGRAEPEHNRIIITNLSLAHRTLVEADFQDSEITNVDFKSANMSRARFSNGTVLYAGFIGSNLINADFSGARVVSSDFTDANLTNVKFTRANLTNCGFSGASLAAADLTDTNLSDAKLEAATGLTFDNLRGAIINKYTTLPANLENRRPELVEGSNRRVAQLKKQMPDDKWNRYVEFFTFFD